MAGDSLKMEVFLCRYARMHADLAMSAHWVPIVICPSLKSVVHNYEFLGRMLASLWSGSSSYTSTSKRNYEYYRNDFVSKFFFLQRIQMEIFWISSQEMLCDPVLFPACSVFGIGFLDSASKKLVVMVKKS